MKKFALASWFLALLTFLCATMLGLFSDAKTEYSVFVGSLCITASPRSMMWTTIVAAITGNWAFYQYRLEQKK